MRKSLTLLVVAAAAAAALVLGTASTGRSTPVASTDALYELCGRVFPDPHAYWPAPEQAPGRSPFAKGNAACEAVDFLQYGELVAGLEYLERLFPRFVTFSKLNEDFGTRVPCAYSNSSEDMCSAGLPQLGAGDVRAKEELYMVRVSDGASNTGKKLFVFPLSIHGIERAGAEAGVRAAEDLAIWGFCEGAASGRWPANPVVDCAREGAIPHRLMEADPSVQSVTAGEALRKSAVYFVFPNADGWRRGDRDNPIHFYQRYNGNGVDLNRDWPTIGYTFRPYTPWSEPETRSFGEVLKRISAKWDGGIDLHGQLVDRAFSFTLLGASQRDFGKNQRILQTAKGAWQDAEARLSWSPLIKPNDAPADDPRVYGVQWGTVWDTIDYTVTGALGDWIDSPLGLNADGIDNEMSLSHLSNCGVGTCYLQDAEQLHVDGNKSLVYSMVNFSLLPEETTFALPGKVAWVNDPTVVSNPGKLLKTSQHTTLRPQAPHMDVLLSPANGHTFAFDVKGPADGVYNGGLEARVTIANVGGVAPNGMLSSLILERKLGGADEPEPAGAPGCDSDRTWVELNRYFNQGVGYEQAGGAVHTNLPLPGRYRVCMENDLEFTSFTADLDVLFSGEKAWEDPGQLPYSVTNMNFFRDLRKYAGTTRLNPVSASDVLAGRVTTDSLVIADDPAPGVTDLARWGQRLRTYVERGGNLVLTDGALANLERMQVVPAGAVTRTSVYAGFVAFTNDNGATDTYGHPLAADVDQPGAAEGSGHRHQTYEPVPIGYAIQDDDGNDLNASPAWRVQQSAWEAAGGETVGQTGSNQVSLGELRLGKGVIRIVGSLLPMPTEAHYHPFGLSSYAVTYTGYQLLDNALQWRRP
jgi:hypothetical protein